MLRRSERQFFYQHDLNAYATKITSDTTEDDIVRNSSKQFLIVGSLFFFPKFSVSKVVDELLIELHHESWDYIKSWDY